MLKSNLLYLDTEFNGHTGQLISMGLCSPTGRWWYNVVLHREWFGIAADNIEPWVWENVRPLLFKYALTDLRPVPDAEFCQSLHTFLKREYEEAGHPLTIIADWPQDFTHFCRALAGPSYEKALQIPLDMTLLVRGDELIHDHMHNALADAEALMLWDLRTRFKGEVTEIPLKIKPVEG